MTTQSINVTLDSNEINVNVDNVQINVAMSSLGTANFISADGKFYLDGNGGTTYLTYNSSSGRVELWVGGSKHAEWGSYSGVNPFA